MLKILIKNSKISVKFSHFLIWNILSCKNNYKKFSNLQSLRVILSEIIQAGMASDIDNSFNQYESFFMQYNSIETFIDKSLIPVNEIYEYTSADQKINMSKSLQAEKFDTTMPFQNTIQEVSKSEKNDNEDAINFNVIIMYIIGIA